MSSDAPGPVGDPVVAWRPRPRPSGVTLVGSAAVLEPLSERHTDDLAQAWAGTDEEHWQYLPMARPVTLADVAGIIRGLVQTPDAMPYAVVVGGRAAGVLSLMRIDPTNGVIEIGAVIFGTELVRTIASTQAQRLLMGHVFEDLGYRRLEWKCDTLNAPSRAAALRLGYTFEGVFRQAVVVKGRNRDTAWLSVIDREWPAVRARLDAWLDPSNHDEFKRQRRRLGELGG